MEHPLIGNEQQRAKQPVAAPDKNVTATCEACGHLQYGERHAQDHAQTCRRLPERLWPEGGAR